MSFWMLLFLFNGYILPMLIMWYRLFRDILSNIDDFDGKWIWFYIIFMLSQVPILNIIMLKIKD